MCVYLNTSRSTLWYGVMRYLIQRPGFIVVSPRLYYTRLSSHSSDRACQQLHTITCNSRLTLYFQPVGRRRRRCYMVSTLGFNTTVLLEGNKLFPLYKRSKNWPTSKEQILAKYINFSHEIAFRKLSQQNVGTWSFQMDKSVARSNCF